MPRHVTLDLKQSELKQILKKLVLGLFYRHDAVMSILYVVSVNPVIVAVKAPRWIAARAWKVRIGNMGGNKQ
jgi:hypothetical protein